MGSPQVSILIATSNRPEALRRCIRSVRAQSYDNLEIVVLSNSPKINSCQEVVEELGISVVECVHLEETLGVPGSRNLLMDRASGEIYVVIDDDAVFENKEAIKNIVDAFHDKIGIQAFKIVDHPEGNSERILAPIPRAHREEQSLNERFLTSYFVGGGHAIHREVIETCGGYNEELVYGAEELDLSFRAIEAGFQILYNPEVVVNHYPEAPIIETATTGKAELYFSVRNKIYIAYRYLPRRFVPSYVLVWVAYFLVESVRMFSPVTTLKGIGAGLKMCLKSRRTPVSGETVKYLKKHYGRLWY